MKKSHFYGKRNDKIKYIVSLIMVLMLGLLLLSGCQPQGTDESQSSEQNQSESSEDTGNDSADSTNSADSADKIEIIATLFPQYDFARAVGGEYVNVTLLLPPGVEAHSYEPTPQDVAKIEKSDLFIYTGPFMEPWAEKMISTTEKTDKQVANVSENVTLLKSEDHDHHDTDLHESGENHDADEHDDHDVDEHDDHDHGEYDPHIWLDPNNAIIMVQDILDHLVAIDPDHQAIYEANAADYIEKLKTLDNDIKEARKGFKSNVIIYGGHFAFGYFAHAYDLEYVSPYSGFAPDAEPTPQKIAEMIDVMDEAHSKAIFYEELIDPRVARVISEETGAEMLLLHGAHNVSKDELSSGVTYVEIMYQNLERLKEGLGYEG